MFHWTIWAGIIVGIATVVLSIIYTVLSEEKKEKISKWFKQPEEGA
jgi:hypothetical protein